MRSVVSRLIPLLLAWLLALGLVVAQPTLAYAEEAEPEAASATRPAAEPAEPVEKEKPAEKEKEPKAEAKSAEPDEAEPAETQQPPRFAEQPETEVAVEVGGTVSVKAKVTDADDYQWQSLDSAKSETGRDVAKATSASFEPATDVAGVYYYRLRASNDAGHTDSEVVTLTVTEPAVAEPEGTDETETGGEENAPVDQAPAVADPEGGVIEEEPESSQASSRAARTAGSFGVSGFVTGTTTTYTHFDGETVTYNPEVTLGEPIRLAGTGWLAKPDRVDEGEEGSVIGFKLIDGTLGQLARQELLENPRLGEPIANNTVWGTVWADSSGDFEIDLEWPNASNAVADPQWKAGDSFTLQLLSGTLYSNEAGVDPSQRPDVSRTVPLTLTVIEPAAVSGPTVTAQPQNASVVEGERALFTAAAAGSPTPTVQWQSSPDGENWTDVPGATETSYAIASAGLELEGMRYRAVFTNVAGSVPTAEAVLTVTPLPAVAPIVTTQPEDLTRYAGTSANFTAVASGRPAPTVQWQYSEDGAQWFPVAGATGTTLTLSGLSLAQDGLRYRALFTNEAGSTPSNPAVLTVLDPGDIPVGGAPYVLEQPQDAEQTTTENAVVTLRAVVASTTPATSVRWEFKLPDAEAWSTDWGYPAGWPGAEQLTTDDAGNFVSTIRLGYSVIGSRQSLANGTRYRAVFTGEGGETTTDPATLTRLVPELVVTSQSPYQVGDTIRGYLVGPDGYYSTRIDHPDGTTNPLGYSYSSGVFYTSIDVSVAQFGSRLEWEYVVPPFRLNVQTSYNPGDSYLAIYPFAAGKARIHFEDDSPAPEAAGTVVDLIATPGDVAPRILQQPVDVAAPLGAAGVHAAEIQVNGEYVAGWQQSARGQYRSTFSFGAVNGTTATLSRQVSTETAWDAPTRLIVANSAGLVISDSVHVIEPFPVSVVADLASARVVRAGETTVLSARGRGAPRPDIVTWHSSTDGANWTPVSEGTTDIVNGTWELGSSLTIPDTPASLNGTRFKAVFGNGLTSAETAVLTLSVADGQVPVAITEHPASQTVEAGESVTYTAGATGVPAPTVQWQRSVDGGESWQDLRGATGTSYAIDGVGAALDGARYRAVFTNAATSQGVATEAATLTVTPRENVREHCGTSYGPGSANTGIPFCFRGPEKVVVGEPIVIEGVGGYLATDDATGSVVNFFLDAEYSGDPNTVYSKKLFTNPATGQPISDRRTNAIVQANADGTWRVAIPWPTVDTISPSSDGQASYTQAELDEKFGVGTTHSFRMLTGSLLASPADRQRGASLYVTVVASLDDEVGVTEPLYDHQTFVSGQDGDAAVAWVQQQVNSGQTIGLTGTGWLTKDQQWGSSVTVRLQDETGAYYQRSGTADDPHADPADPTVWQVVQASEFGDLDVGLQMPTEAVGGDFLAVELTTTDDGTPLGDVTRHWVSEPLVIDNVAYVPSLGEDATCTAAPADASYELAPGMAVPAANVGGTIRLTGKDWCNLIGGGSLIAIKINDGAYSRLATETAPMYDANLGKEVGTCPAGICISNKTVWYVIEADKYGSFDVQIPLPTRTNSSPAFGEGAYTLRIMTRTLSADAYYQGSRPDPSRTMKSPEFTVVAEGVPLDDVKPGEPSAAPDPLHATDDLTNAARGGVTVEQQKTRWLVTVPAAEEGDWVYANVYDGESPRFPWNTQWFQVNSAKRILLPLAGATLPTGTNKLSVQDRNGELLGWARVTVAAEDETDTPTTRPIKLVSLTSLSSTLGQPKPDTTPAAPVAGYADLTDENVGRLTAVESDGKIVVTVPEVDGGHWVYLYLYTETGRVIGIDWVQVGTDHTITVNIANLPNGIHKLALVGEDATLLGWVTANGPAPLEQATTTDDTTTGGTTGTAEGGQPAGGAPVPAAPPVATGPDATWTLLLLGLAVLVLAGSAAGVITLRSPVRPRS